MRNQICFLFLFNIFFTSISLATSKPKILTSISPVASLAAMVAGDVYDIEVVAKQQGCPHSFFMKPSDIKLAKSADIYIYINEGFEQFTKPLLKHFNGIKINLSENDNLNVIDDNWHIWLLPENAIAIIEQITNDLSKALPEQKNYFNNRKNIALEKLHKLSDQRQKILADREFLVLGESLAYLCTGTKAKCIHYKTENGMSLKNYSDIQKSASKKEYCVIVNSSIDNKKYLLLAKDKNMVGQIDSENWIINTPVDELYTNQIALMLETLSRCHP